MNEKLQKITINDLWMMDRPTEEQRNLAKNDDIVGVIDKVQSMSDTLAPFIHLREFPVTVTQDQFETIIHAITENKNELDIDPFSPESPKKENFVICPDALSVQQLQKFDLQQMLIKEQIEALTHMWFPNATKEQQDQQLSEETIKIITDYIPRGICVSDLRVISIGHGNYYQQTQVFDMDIAKAEIIKKLTYQIKESLIKPENIEICLGHDPPQIRLLQAKYPVIIDTFQIDSQLLPNEQHSAYNYWCVIKDANEEKQAQKERLQNKSHFVHIKVSAVAAIVVSEDQYLTIENKQTAKQKTAAAHRTFVVKVSQILSLGQRLESSPDFMIALMIEKDIAHSTELIFNETPPDHTRFIHNDIIFSDDNWDSWDDDDWDQSHNNDDFNQMRMAITAPGIKQKFHFQTMIDQTEVIRYQSMLTAFKLAQRKMNLEIENLVLDNEAINVKYNDETMKALEAEVTRLRNFLRDSSSEPLQIQLNEREQELINRRRDRISKLERQKKIQQQLKEMKEKKPRIDKLIKLYSEKTYSPVFHETIQLRSHRSHQNGMVNMTIIIGINSSLNRLAQRRVSIQANSVDRLLMMNFKQGVIKYKPDSRFHHDTGKMKKLIANLERTYRTKKERELFSRVKSEKEDEFVKKYLEGEIDLEYGVIDILKFSNCLGNKHHQENVPYNHLNATTSTNKIKYINQTDGCKQIMIIDKETKRIYITREGCQDDSTATAITRTMNAIPEQLQLDDEEEDIELSDIDIELNEIDIGINDVEVKSIEKEKQGVFRVKIKESIEEITEIQPTLEMQHLIDVTWNHEENNNDVKKWKTIIMNEEQTRVLRQHHKGAIPYKSLICTIERKKIMKAAGDINCYKSGWTDTTFEKVVEALKANRNKSSSI